MSEMEFSAYFGNSQTFEGGSDMVPAGLAARSHPKRKRAHVSYYEGGSDESDAGGSSSTVEDMLPRKKRKRSFKAASSKPLPKRKIFPFNSLPAELKNTIYAYALTDPNGVFLSARLKRYRRTVKRVLSSAIYTNDYSRYGRRGYTLPQSASDPGSKSASVTLPGLVPNLLVLNHQIYNESRPILYSNNAFVLQNTTALHSFLATIGPRNVAALADVTIKGWGYSRAHKALNHPAFTLLASAVNLRRLRLDCQIGWYSSAQRVATQVYRDAFHFLEAVGSAKGKWDAALDLIEILEGNFVTSRHRVVSARPNPSHEELMKIFQDELRKRLR